MSMNFNSTVNETQFRESNKIENYDNKSLYTRKLTVVHRKPRVM